jgi:enediyne biosynthesis protein E4
VATASSRRLIVVCLVLFYSILLAAGAGDTQPLFTRMVSAPDEINSRFVVVADYDNDGWADIVRSGLWGNQGGDGFVKRTPPDMVLNSLKDNLGGGVVVGDYDNDGDLDLFVSVGSYDTAALNRLYRNDRGTWTDVTRAAGLTDELPTDNALWLDYDRDGLLDLYTGNMIDPATRNKLYRNNGDGTFADVTGEVGLDVQLHSNLGGSNGGMAAPDFDGDGWPDLYVGVFGEPNRLFLRDEVGGFRDATTSDTAHPGEAFGIAVGDVDNDGDLDIFQAAGGGSDRRERSILLLNLGQGAFLDVTDPLGLSELNVALLAAGLADVDNDGDLDLMTVYPHFLFRNKGDGMFTNATAASGLPSNENYGLTLSFGDLDGDGFLDVALRQPYLNTGNGNHWLRVELVGTESNRSGIGTRVVARAGDLMQTREILGGLGFYQDELVAHFGLGERTQVDALEIRWPSGQVDVLTDIPADQKIRVIEGREVYHVVVPTIWEGTSDSLVVGSAVDFEATVRPALFEADAQIARVTADLSLFGGGEDTPLEEMGDGTYRLRAPLRPVENGIHLLVVMVDQTTSLGSYWVRLEKGITVFPEVDLEIFWEEVAEGWSVESDEASVHPQEMGGRTVLALETPAFWKMDCLPLEPVSPAGYSHLRFAFHPGNAVAPRSGFFSVNVNNAQVKLLGQKTLTGVGIDMEINDWQVVDVPLDSLQGFEGLIESIRFSGNLEGTLYLDDIRLITTTPPPSVTAVTEAHTASLPQTFTLDQNYPNPFNSATVIRFALPVGGDVELSIFNLAGQRVATLADGTRAAGAYTINWDGRDDDGRALASGVYLYRLRTGDGQQVETRKLILLR